MTSILARVIVADCPWWFNDRHLVRKDGKATRYGGGAAGMYSAGCMRTEDLMTVPVTSLCAPDAYLFQWSTLNHVKDAFQVAGAWGFTYTGARFTWEKVYREDRLDEIAELFGLELSDEELEQMDAASFFGRGSWIPSNMEDCWMFYRGRPWHPHKMHEKHGWKPKQVIHARFPRHPAGHEKAGKVIHSRKPEKLQERLERWLKPHLAGHQMIELFATRRRPGWYCMGHALSGMDIKDEINEYLATALELRGWGR